MSGAALVWDLVAVDKASPSFLRVAGSADKAATATARAAKSTKSSLAGMAALGSKLTKGITLPLAAVAAVGAKNAIQFQKQMTLLRTAAGETDANMKVISSGIKRVSSDTATSLHELGDGMYIIGKAARSRDWTGADQLKILKAAAQGAKSEMVPLATATDALTTVMTDYHSKASDAVKVENQLVVASGLAKTTFGEFSSSLSNVSPIASSLGVSLKEVLGSLATMTQHGVSPQQATENMRNLLFNLAGQNNVASAAMQQLGINTVDLAKNLGRRGLTGTLAVVDAALKAHTKDGMVVVNIHKAAALATKSLNTMLGGMGGKLKDNSAGLLKGGVGITAYTKYAKSLGGQAGASALQFLALYKSSLGFSNQLKSGKGTVSTTIQQYQKMLGGMTGAAVAMQIAGKYAKDNAKNVAAVGAAAGETGKNVHGWELTQHTLSYKLQDASNKASLFATNLGSHLLPALGKIADVGTAAFKSFDGMSHSQKMAVGWSVGVLAAIGPVLLIGTKLTTLGTRMGNAAAGVSAAMTRIAGTSFTTSVRVNTAMRGITGALAGAAIGATVGSFTRNASTTTKALSALGSAAAGAAIGFGTGGPLGAVIGGIAGGVSSLATSFIGMGHKATAASKEAQAALRQQNQVASDLLTTLQSVNGAYGQQYKNALSNDLLKSGALGAAATAGIQPGDITAAVLGDKGAMNRILQAGPAATMGVGVDAKGNPVPGARLGMGPNGDITSYDPRVKGIVVPDPKVHAAYLKLLDTIGNLSPAAKKAERDYELLSKAEGTSIVPTNLLAGGVKNLAKELKGTGTALDQTSAYGIRNTLVITANAQAISNTAVARAKDGKSAVLAAANYTVQEDKLRATAIALGFNKAAVEKLTASYQHLPKQVVTQLKKIGVTPGDIEALISKYGHLPRALVTAVTKKGVKPADIQAIIDKLLGIPAHRNTSVTVTDHASARLAVIQGHLSSIHGKTVVIDTVYNTDRRAGANGIVPHATGGSVADGYFTVGESTNPNSWELGHKSGPRVQFWSNAESRSMTGMRNVPGYAKGTPKTTTAPSKPLQVAGGRLEITRGSTGQLEAWVRDLILEEQDFDRSLNRMGRR